MPVVKVYINSFNQAGIKSWQQLINSAIIVIASRFNYDGYVNQYEIRFFKDVQYIPIIVSLCDCFDLVNFIHFHSLKDEKIATKSGILHPYGFPLNPESLHFAKDYEKNSPKELKNAKLFKNIVLDSCFPCSDD